MRYKCTVSYIGANYKGWQSQLENTSISEAIEASLKRITNKDIVITGSGRTDAKVNAKGQVFHFDSELEMSEYKWKGAINAFLPKDIYIEKAEKVHDTFHARHTVKEKEYEYHIMTNYDVYKKDYALYYPYPLDLTKMKEASKVFIGKHNFTSFNASPLEEYPDQVRTIKEIIFKEVDNEIIITFIGKGFLRYMVRMMVAALIEVGKEKMNKEDIIYLLEHPSKTGFSKNVEAQGLTLKEVKYFDVLALNEEGMIREFIDGDIDIKGEGKVFAFTTRHSQELLGYLDIKDNEAILYVYNEKELNIAHSLEDELLSRLKEDNDSIKLIIQ